MNPKLNTNPNVSLSEGKVKNNKLYTESHEIISLIILSVDFSQSQNVLTNGLQMGRCC